VALNTNKIFDHDINESGVKHKIKYLMTIQLKEALNTNKIFDHDINESGVKHKIKYLITI